MNGKTRDFYDARAMLNEKTLQSDGRDSANPVKMHTEVNEKICRGYSSRVRSKAKGLQLKENPGPKPLPGKMQSNLTCL